MLVLHECLDNESVRIVVRMMEQAGLGALLDARPDDSGRAIDNVFVADECAPHRFRREAVRSFGQSPSVGELQDAEVVEANPVFGLRRTVVALDADLVLARGW